MVRFYRCAKCGHQFMTSQSMARNDFKCGAIVEYISADNPEATGGDFLPSIGIKPLGCGGKISEVSTEEAMSYVPE